MSAAISIRTVKQDDIPFIYASWLKHYKHFSYFAKRIRNDTFFLWHHIIIEKILERKSTTVLIAHLKEDPDVIIGYFVLENMGEPSPVLHFMFVKEKFQRFGVAKAMIEHAKADLNSSVFTHWTFDMDSIIKSFPGLSYNPYRV